MKNPEQEQAMDYRMMAKSGLADPWKIQESSGPPLFGLRQIHSARTFHRISSRKFHVVTFSLILAHPEIVY